MSQSRCALSVNQAPTRHAAWDTPVDAASAHAACPKPWWHAAAAGLSRTAAASRPQLHIPPLSPTPTSQFTCIHAARDRYYNYHVNRSLQAILEQLLEGLKRLEYRGYDSSGLCVDSVDALGDTAPSSPRAHTNGGADGSGHANGDANGHAGGAANGAANGHDAGDEDCPRRLSRCARSSLGHLAFECVHALLHKPCTHAPANHWMHQGGVPCRPEREPTAGPQQLGPVTNTSCTLRTRALDDSTAPIVIKSVGKITNLEALVAQYARDHALDTSKEFAHHVGIAHTRWATHGRPTPVNSHPHVSAGGASWSKWGAWATICRQLPVSCIQQWQSSTCCHA